jgi:hypothetical protein
VPTCDFCQPVSLSAQARPAPISHRVTGTDVDWNTGKDYVVKPNKERAQSDPQWGGELVYKRRLAQQSWGTWGLEAAVGYLDLNIRDSQALTGNAAVTTDSYPLGGLIPPQAPYAGSLAGPGILIGDSPTRTVATLGGGQVVSGRRELDGSLYNGCSWCHFSQVVYNERDMENWGQLCSH